MREIENVDGFSPDSVKVFHVEIDAKLIKLLMRILLLLEFDEQIDGNLVRSVRIEFPDCYPRENRIHCFIPFPSCRLFLNELMFDESSKRDEEWTISIANSRPRTLDRN